MAICVLAAGMWIYLGLRCLAKAINANPTALGIVSQDDVAWLEREKFTLRPDEHPQANRAAHNARIDRILAVCRRELGGNGEERDGLRSK